VRTKKLVAERFKEFNALCTGIVVLAISFLLVPADVRGACMGIGASVRYSWWDPYWSQVSDTRILPRIKVKSDFSGGPVVSIGIDDTWGLFASYAYGKYEGGATSLLLNPLFYYIEQPVTTKRVARRHEFNLFVSGQVASRVKIFGGIVYSGYDMVTESSVLFLAYSNRIFHHFAGPAAGVDFTIPLVSTLYLLPGVSAVFQFSRFVVDKNNIFSEAVNTRFGGTDTTLLYAGLNCTLSLAYYIQKIGLAVALGGRFHYLWIEDIDADNFVADGRHDLFGSIHLTLMYTFDLLKSPGSNAVGQVPLPKVL